MDAPPSSGRAAVGWLAVTFFLLGAIGASWISRIPAVASDLHLGTARLGAALLGMPAGSVVVSLVLPRALHTSTRRVVQVALPAAAASLAVLPRADSALTLGGALAGFGVATGAVDVAMNAHAVAVQRRFSGSLFSRWHAMWSLGGFAGAGVGGLAADAGVSPGRHLALVAAVTGAASLVVGQRLTSEPVHEERTGVTWTRNRAVLVLTAAAVAAFVVEIGAADWVGVFVRRDLGASAGAAAAVFASFALPHFVVRLVGDAVVDRVSRRTVLAGGLVVATAGFVVVVTSVAAAQAMVGLAVCGAGIALVVPVAFAAAGSVAGVAPGAGVATAAGWSYAAWAVTPPAIGLVAAGAGLRVGLVMPCVAAAVAALTVSAARRV